jgi:clan AA aspartic protease
LNPGGDGLGTFRVTIEVGNPEGSQFESVRALVDTGASYTTVPASLLRGLGVPVHSRVNFILADGRRIARDVGQTWIRIDGKAVISLVVFGDEGTDALLGAYTLQGLLLGVDTPNERLVPVPGLLM